MSYYKNSWRNIYIFYPSPSRAASHLPTQTHTESSVSARRSVRTVECVLPTLAHLPELKEKCKALQEQTCSSPSSWIACSTAVKPISNVCRSFYRDICFATNRASWQRLEVCSPSTATVCSRPGTRYNTQQMQASQLYWLNSIVLSWSPPPHPHVPAAKNSFAKKNFAVASLKSCRSGFYLFVLHRLKC